MLFSAIYISVGYTDMRYTVLMVYRIPPIRERSTSEAEFDISRINSPFRITRSGWKTGVALWGEDGSLISVKETVL